jgi:alkylation response protein AidB-like acyl-CoA dehydrogenase
MDLSLNPEYEGFRAEVRNFIAREWKAPAKGADRETRVKAEREFRLKAIAAGYMYRGVPKKYGGSEQAPDPVKANIIREEFRAARAPQEISNPNTLMLVPTLLEHGSDWQKEKFIAKTIMGEIQWAQGYSEPGAGSDLASLRTRAELVDGNWVINGQKIWTTLAHHSQYMYMLARTEPNAKKHAGISYLLLDMKAPGITIRPLKQATGASEFCEVFFDNVKTPEDWIVGERGKGWTTVSRSTLKHERNMIGGTTRLDGTFGSLVKLAKRRTIDGKPAIEDPVIRDRLAQIAGYIESLRYSSLRQMSMDLRGQDAGIYGVIPKLAGTEVNSKMALLARDLIGDDLLLEPPVEGGLVKTGEKGGKRGEEQWVAQFMTSLAFAIAGGTSNVQRNIIAERGLGLPRG